MPSGRDRAWESQPGNVTDRRSRLPAAPSPGRPVPARRRETPFLFSWAPALLLTPGRGAHARARPPLPGAQRRRAASSLRSSVPVPAPESPLRSSIPVPTPESPLRSSVPVPASPLRSPLSPCPRPSHRRPWFAGLLGLSHGSSRPAAPPQTSAPRPAHRRLALVAAAEPPSSKETQLRFARNTVIKPWPGWLQGLERGPVNRTVAGSIPTQGSHPGPSVQGACGLQLTGVSP